jgi:hypothetical protein
MPITPRGSRRLGGAAARVEVRGGSRQVGPLLRLTPSRTHTNGLARSRNAVACRGAVVSNPAFSDLANWRWFRKQDAPNEVQHDEDQAHQSANDHDSRVPRVRRVSLRNMD